MPNSMRRFYEAIDDPAHVPGGGIWNLASIRNLFEPDPHARFLDIGCYDASKTAFLADTIGTQETYGLDLLAWRLKTAAARNIRVALVDLNETRSLPYAPDSFHVIYVGDVIEHIFSPDFLVEEIRRLLCPGGYAILTTPNLSSWRNRIALLLGWQPFGTEISTRYRLGNPRAAAGWPVGHIRIFTPRAMRELIEHYDLCVEFTGGLIVNGPRNGLTRIAGLVDDLVAAMLPELCDEMVVKVRKPV